MTSIRDGLLSALAFRSSLFRSRSAAMPRHARRRPLRKFVVQSAVAIVAVQFAALAAPARAFEVIATSPARYALGVPADIFTIAVVFDDTPDLVDPATQIRVAGTESGIHNGSFAISGDSLLWYHLDLPFFPGEIVHVNYRRDIKSVAGDSLIGGHYFAFTVASAPATMAWSPRVGYRGADQPYFIYGGDLDGDRTPDLAVPNELDDNLSVFLNPFGSGYFPNRVEYAVTALPSSCFGSDLDNDGDQDVVTADINGDRISVLLNEGDGTFAPSTSYVSGDLIRQVFGGDFDGDNDIDLVSTSTATNRVYLWYNNGDGTFPPGQQYTQVPARPFAVETGDFDLDGHLDIAAACQIPAVNDSVAILLNNGTGGFTTTGVYRVGGESAWELSGNDIDADGDFDLVVVNAANPQRIAFLFNDGAGAFPTRTTAVTGSFPLGVFTADLDGDNDIDAISSNYSGGSINIFTNDGAGAFLLSATLPTRVSGSYTWAHDLDGDGDLDLSVADELADSIFVFYNGSSPATDVPDVAQASSAAQGTIALWPNPVRAGGVASLRLEGMPGAVVVDVYAVDGRKVRRLWSGPLAGSRGEGELSWDGRDEGGRVVASGRYFVAAQAGARTLTREVQLVR
jgi:FG-GAP-like repeat